MLADSVNPQFSAKLQMMWAAFGSLSENFGRRPSHVVSTHQRQFLYIINFACKVVVKMEFGHLVLAQSLCAPRADDSNRSHQKISWLARLRVFYANRVLPHLKWGTHKDIPLESVSSLSTQTTWHKVNRASAPRACYTLNCKTGVCSLC